MKYKSIEIIQKFIRGYISFHKVILLLFLTKFIFRQNNLISLLRLKHNFDYFDSIKHDPLSQSQRIIRYYWLKRLRRSKQQNSTKILSRPQNQKYLQDLPPKIMHKAGSETIKNQYDKRVFGKHLHSTLNSSITVKINDYENKRTAISPDHKTQHYKNDRFSGIGIH